MGDAEFLNIVVTLWYQLDSRLSRFTTGDSWRRYLSMLTGVLPPVRNDGVARISIQEINKKLDRYNRVAANPQYSMIANLPSFISMHRVLQHMAARFQGDVDADLETVSETFDPIPESSSPESPVPENLPAPENVTEPPRQGSAQERSILKQ